MRLTFTKALKFKFPPNYSLHRFTSNFFSTVHNNSCRTEQQLIWIQLNFFPIKPESQQSLPDSIRVQYSTSPVPQPLSFSSGSMYLSLILSRNFLLLSMPIVFQGFAIRNSLQTWQMQIAMHWILWRFTIPYKWFSQLNMVKIHRQKCTSNKHRCSLPLRTFMLLSRI